MAEFAGTPIICAFRERVSAQPGETIRIAADPALVHLFDAGTGAAIERLIAGWDLRHLTYGGT